MVLELRSYQNVAYRHALPPSLGARQPLPNGDIPTVHRTRTCGNFWPSRQFLRRKCLLYHARCLKSAPPHTLTVTAPALVLPERPGVWRPHSPELSGPISMLSPGERILTRIAVVRSRACLKFRRSSRLAGDGS
ncbi:MAG: hypothetical protein XD82_0331 [Methanoculleus marisnigri]|uniref:Uncharacterized protein n=1 Tax=Methanoculleus marisnigri TaxID=2198 RepID=A0A101GRR4_9EURY|nr:MAG: hypothetical protein XD82_0331 [Methanoculleus marisnigri]